MLHKFSLYREGLRPCSIFLRANSAFWHKQIIEEFRTKCGNWRVSFYLMHAQNYEICAEQKNPHSDGNPSFHLVLKICFGFFFILLKSLIMACKKKSRLFVETLFILEFQLIYLPSFSLSSEFSLLISLYSTTLNSLSLNHA